MQGSTEFFVTVTIRHFIFERFREQQVTVDHQGREGYPVDRVKEEVQDHEVNKESLDQP